MVNVKFYTICHSNFSVIGVLGAELILSILFRSFGFIAPKTLNYLVFQYFDFERTWWRLFVGTKFDIYVFIVYAVEMY